MSPACYEWIAFEGVLPATTPLAAAAATSPPLAIAPARWLLVEPDEALLAVLGSAESAGAGALIEVTGRWQRIRLRDPERLRAGVALDQVLRDRAVACCWIFDCPTILARDGAGLDCWVEASYAASFTDVLTGLGGSG